MSRPARLLAAVRALGTVRLMAGGLLALQLVWIFAVPPFRGLDEFDHAYRAAAVARGQWAPPPEAATRGTGAWVEVPAGLVRAANPECSLLKYAGDEDCVGTPADDGNVRVATGAGRYHPAYYAVIGLPALPFDGAASLYIMRLAGSLLAWAFFVLALVATRCWARTRWPYVALAVATTPVVVYSTVLPAPNGPEMTAALALWSSLLGLAVRPDASRDRGLLVIGTLSAVVLVSLRSFGPLWGALVLVTVLLAVRVSRPRLREIVVASKGWLAMAVVLLATLGSLAWIRAMGALVIGVNEDKDPLSALTKAGTTAHEMVLWVFQSVAAFPLRNQHTHPAVYALFFVLFGSLVVTAVRAARARGRAGLLGAVALSLLVPAAVTFATLEEYGTAWQGRYTLPYSFGIVLLAGMLLDTRERSVRTDVLLGGAALFTAAHAASPLLVAVQERLTSPGVDNGAWVLVPLGLLGAVAVAGASLLWLGAAFGHDGGVEPGDDEAPEEVADDRPQRLGLVVGADR